MHYKKLRVTLIVVILILLLLIVRIGFLQFVQGNYLKELAYNQQTINQIISPKRGNIYDSTGKALAISAQVDTITINPNKLVKNSNDETKEFKEKIAKGLSEIFELNYDEVLEKVNSSSQVETIAKKVEQEKVDTLKKWMEDNKISVGINIDEDTKRYYPYNTVASNVIGFCGSDNQGLSGVESKWDSILTGTPGKIVSSKGSNQEEIPNAEETYISAENGSDLTLTIDLNIQTIIEKYLKQAVEDNDCKKGGNVIVMNPKNGDILGMACYPDYNLNSPYTPNSTLAETYNSLSSEEKSESLYKMWANKSVAETYEPGSVFKVITASVALEENITTTDKSNDFYCKGYEEFEDSSASQPLKISCWRANPHGVQSLRQALCNSCNPAFMQLGKRIGAPTLYKYYEAFGLFDSTNSGLYGEQSSIFQKLDKVGPVELATMSFGQSFQITPVQFLTAASAIVNGGNLVTPHFGVEIRNENNETVKKLKYNEKKNVISKDVSEKMKYILEKVVAEGTGNKAQVEGYRIGGKTATSQKLPRSARKYIASFMAFAPANDPQVIAMIIVDEPQGVYYGGTVVGPLMKQLYENILPYVVK